LHIAFEGRGIVGCHHGSIVVSGTGKQSLGVRILYRVADLRTFLRGHMTDILILIAIVILYLLVTVDWKWFNKR